MPPILGGRIAGVQQLILCPRYGRWDDPCPVRDRSALEFARTFYLSLVTERLPLGRAALNARHVTRDADGDPTWLAYAVYGSPSAVVDRAG